MYSWKRTLSPELAADYAYQLYGIEGAAEYNGCTKNCDALADKVGVKAVDDQHARGDAHVASSPGSSSRSSHHSFLAVNQKAVEQFGDNWTEPGQHRHERPVHARVVGSRGVDQPREEPRLA